MGDKIAMLIAAKADRMRNSLHALLMSISNVAMVMQTDNISVALDMITSTPPDLMILDTNLPQGETWSILEQSKTKRPDLKCIVLANNSYQQQVAEAMGADKILLKGYPSQMLFSSIKTLLSENIKKTEGECYEARTP